MRLNATITNQTQLLDTQFWLAENQVALDFQSCNQTQLFMQDGPGGSQLHNKSDLIHSFSWHLILIIVSIFDVDLMKRIIIITITKNYIIHSFVKHEKHTTWHTVHSCMEALRISLTTWKNHW